MTTASGKWAHGDTLADLLEQAADALDLAARVLSDRTIATLASDRPVGVSSTVSNLSVYASNLRKLT